jgi:hypothetical protein
MSIPLNKGQINALIDQALDAVDLNVRGLYHERNQVANKTYKTRIDNTLDTEFSITIFLRPEA